MSKNKVHSKKVQLIRVSSIVLFVAFSTGGIFGYSKEDIGLFFSITGITLSYQAVIVAAHKIISEKVYNVRLNELAEQDSKQRKDKHYTDINLSTNEKAFNESQKTIDSELDRFMEFDDVAKAHVKLSIVLVVLGATFQIAGATLGV